MGTFYSSSNSKSITIFKLARVSGHSAQEMRLLADGANPIAGTGARIVSIVRAS
jgi:hypothetical protein